MLDVSKLKKRNRVLIGLGILIIFVIILWNNNRRLEFSVHDLNWEDIIGMNGRISDATFTNLPWVRDDQVHGVGHLNTLLNFFANNLENIGNTSRTGNISIKLYLTEITGDEKFLGDVNPSVWERNDGSFELTLYIDNSLERNFFDALNASAHERFAYENPNLVDMRSALIDIDWDDLLENYETLIYGLVMSKTGRGGTFIPIEIMNPKDVLEVLRVNKDKASLQRDDIHDFRFSILFKRQSEETPVITAIFFMPESVHEEILHLIDEDVWEKARNLN